MNVYQTIDHMRGNLPVDYIDEFIRSLCHKDIEINDCTYDKVWQLIDDILDVIGHLSEMHRQLISCGVPYNIIHRFNKVCNYFEVRYHILSKVAIGEEFYCPACCQYKDITQVNILSTYKCKACMNAKSAKHYQELGKVIKKQKYDENPAAKIEYQKKYYEENKDEVSARKKQHYQENRLEIIAKQVERDKDRVEERAAYGRKYRSIEANKKKDIERKKKRNKENPVYKLRGLVSCAIRRAIKELGGSKNGESFTKYVDYPISKLVKHIESKFEWWMTWKNHGVYDPKTWDDNDPTTWKWQLDHIESQADLPFDRLDHPNLKKCWGIENLRPYSAKQNCLDGAYRTRNKKK